MPKSSLPLLSLLLAGCPTLTMLTPKGEVPGYEPACFAHWERPDVAYLDDPRVPFPVPPVQVWGIAYDLDLVVKSRHPDYDLHEYARIETADGPLWLAKDARCVRAPGGTDCVRLEQTIVADLDEVQTWLPEVPVPRARGVVAVDDRSTGRDLDLDLSYTNIDGDPVTVSFQARRPSKRLAKRNGHTMGHSAHVLMPVLDLSMRTLGRAEMTIGGAPARPYRIAGIPVVAAIVQTQGGFSTGELRMVPDGGAIRVSHGEAIETWS
jgi:hypothetical protein